MISVAVMHSPWRPERVAALAEMLPSLVPLGPLWVQQDRMPAGDTWAHFKTVLAMRQWAWSLSQLDEVTHHLFVTDDLHLAPRFGDILAAMIAAKPDAIIGLLSNHPRGPALHAAGASWYRCNSWVVGPAYLLPRRHLQTFRNWYWSLPDDETPGRGVRWFNDDSALNEWNTRLGPGESWHPLPTPIEHRVDLVSTVGHGDRYSRERLSWREVRQVVDDAAEGGPRFWWRSDPVSFYEDEMVRRMCDVDYWRTEGAMLPVGGE